MTTLEYIVDGYFINRKPSSDTFEVWFLFTQQHGLLTCLHRQRKRVPRSAKGSADLWDRMELEWRQSDKAGPHSPRFVKDYRIAQHHDWLGQNWHRLEYAARLARMLEQNLAEGEARPELFQLIEQALQAWQQPLPPCAVYMKFLLRWVHLEGYGHPAQWPGATPASADLWRQLTRNPLHTLTTADLPWLHAMDELDTFIRQQTAFHMD